MGQEDAGIGEPSPTGTSGQERRWAILRWLSVKLHDAPASEILEAAERAPGVRPKPTKRKR